MARHEDKAQGQIRVERQKQYSVPKYPSCGLVQGIVSATLVPLHEEPHPFPVCFQVYKKVISYYPHYRSAEVAWESL